MKSKVILSTFIYTLLGFLMFTQLGVAKVLAEDSDNPITSAITSVIEDITNTEDPEDQESEDAPITSPITSPINSSGDVNLTSTQTRFLISSDTVDLNINIPANVINPTVDFSNVLISTLTSAIASVTNDISITRTSSIGSIKVQMPEDLTITGPAGWNGIINAPSLQSNTSVTLPNNTSASAVVEVGANDTPLTFDKAVRILLPNQANKLVGFSRGDNFTAITNACSADSQATADLLSAGADCYINVGSDLVVWTKHFTKFVAYSQNTVALTAAGVPSCSDSKPTSAPRIISAGSAQPNQVTLVWSGVNPASYYLVAYGTKSEKMEYGNPNVGNTTTYTVKGLSGGQTYFFKVRSGNGCAIGEFSSEVKVMAVGPKINNKAATDFEAGVLSSKAVSAANAKIATSEAKFQPITAAKADRVLTESGNFFTRIWNFIKGLFTH